MQKTVRRIRDWKFRSAGMHQVRCNPAVTGLVFLFHPQQCSWVHSFFTINVRFRIAIVFVFRQSASIQSARCSEALPMRVRRLPVIPTRVSHRRDFRFARVNWCPGVAASSDVLPYGLDRNAERAVRPRKRQERDLDGSHERGDQTHFCIPRKRQSERIGLNNAAWVAGPGRICVFRCRVLGRAFVGFREQLSSTIEIDLEQDASAECARVLSRIKVRPHRANSPET